MLRSIDDAVNLTLGDGVSIGAGVRVGPNVTIGDGTVIGDGCVIEANAVLGKVPQLARTSSASRAVPAPLELGAQVTVCVSAVLYAGARVGDESIIGDLAQVRERSTVGRETVIGRGTAVDNDVTVGDRVKVQTNVYLTAFTIVEDDVFVGPGASTTNDDTMNRHGADYQTIGATLRRACRVGGSAVLVPGVEVGEEAFVAAGAVVTKDVAPRSLVAGVPARELRQVADDELLERWR
jgi:acetyltransferase-like isoleucine patch superfamily enzyme